MPPSFQIAGFLNPAVFGEMAEDDRRQAKQLIISRATDHNKPLSSTVGLTTTTPDIAVMTATSTTTARPSKSNIKLFREKCGIATSPDRRTKTVGGIHRELLKYSSMEFGENDTFEMFWRQNSVALPILSDMARRYGCIPATSVPSESSFSIAGYLVRKSRTSLTSRNLKYSMFLKDKL